MRVRRVAVRGEDVAGVFVGRSRRSPRRLPQPEPAVRVGAGAGGFLARDARRASSYGKTASGRRMLPRPSRVVHSATQLLPTELNYIGAPADTQSDPTRRYSMLSNARVLLAGGDEPSLHSLHRMLESAGHVVARS